MKSFWKNSHPGIKFCVTLALFQPLAVAEETVRNQKSGVTFKARLLTIDANEGVSAGDIDGDGVTDIVAGRNWFAAVIGQLGRYGVLKIGTATFKAMGTFYSMLMTTAVWM